MRRKCAFRRGGCRTEPLRKIAHQRRHLSRRREVMPAAIGLDIAALIGIAAGHVRV